MKIELKENLQTLLDDQKLDEAIKMAEEELKQLPETKFHKIIGKNLIDQSKTDKLIEFLVNFDKSTREILKKNQGFFKSLFYSDKEVIPAAYYCSIDDYLIDEDLGFELRSFKEMNTKNWNWLNNASVVFEYHSIAEDFKIMPNFDFYENDSIKDQNIESVLKICDWIAILRIQELCREVYKDSVLYDWGKIPMFISGEENKLMYRVN